MVHLKSHKDITFSANLIEQALNHVNFLSRVDEMPILNSQAVLTRSLYRYETYWLPLASDHLDQCLSAPIDIEWVWHCHMLRPSNYISDCEAVTGHVINHVYRSSKAYESALKKSKSLWEEKFPDEPFCVDFNEHLGDSDLPNGGSQSKITYDIITAAGRQKEFFYNVSLPHYRDEKFLQLAVERYQKMLYLKQEEPHQFLVPCFDNDLVWHTHQANPRAYSTDMIRLFGEVFDHDDSVNERSEGSKLNTAFSQTTATWPKYFNEHLSQPGTMYRGKTPDGVLYKLTSGDVLKLATKKTSVSIDLVLTLKDKRTGRLYISSSGYAGSKKMTHFCKSENVPYKSVMTFKTQTFDFDTRVTNRVIFEITNKDSSSNYVGETTLNLAPRVESETGQNGDTFKETLILETGGSLEISGQLSTPMRGNILLFINRGDYKPGTIPENVREEWGPMNMDKLAPRTDTGCIIATHVLKNHIGQADLSARVMHCPSVCQSFVQVFHMEKMAAVAHFIGTDQLPTPDRAGKAVITLSPNDGERAMLIKNHAGDWAVVVAKWVASKKLGKEKGPPGCNGLLNATIYKMTSGQVSRCELGYTSQTFKFDTGAVKADLPKCTIEIDKDTTEATECVCLTLVLAILRDRCVPNKP